MASDTHSDTRPLDGLALSLSISRSGEAETLGFSDGEINNTVREISTAVLAQGGRVLFGHDWRPEGVMAEIYNLALHYQSRSTQTRAAGGALIRNYVPWPSRTTLSREDRKRHGDVLEIIETEPGFQPTGTPKADRVESLTHMRHALTDAADARICIGGRTTGSGGRCAGIVEEAALMMKARKPLYLTGMFGGASQQIIDVLTGNDASDTSAFRPSEEVAQAMEQAGFPLQDYGIDPAHMRDFGLERLAEDNHLSVEENLRLFEATHLYEVLGLLLTALGRLSRRHRA